LVPPLCVGYLAIAHADPHAPFGACSARVIIGRSARKFKLKYAVKHRKRAHFHRPSTSDHAGFATDATGHVAEVALGAVGVTWGGIQTHGKVCECQREDGGGKQAPITGGSFFRLNGPFVKRHVIGV
jgi:hypothetical protein